MKTPTVIPRSGLLRLKLPLLAGLGLALAGSASAQTSGTWNVNANGNWSATGSWLGGTVPDGVGGTANFDFDITADRTVTIDTARTIGNLLIRDGALASNAYIIGLIASTNTFTMDDGANKPTITLYPRTGTAIIARIDQPISGTNGMEIVSGDVPGVRVEMAYGNVANTFSGSVSVGRDVRLRLDNNGSLGVADALATETSGLPTVSHFTEVLNGGTLNTNAKNLGTEYVKVQGTGVDGTGALVNLGAGQNNTLQQVELTGDATVGGSGRWDIRTGGGGAGRLFQNGFNLTKVGANQVSLVATTVVGNGDFNINAGTLSIETTSNCVGAGNIYINGGAFLLFWTNTGNVTRPIVANGGSVTAAANAATSNIASPVELRADLSFVGTSAAGFLNMNGPITETGGSFGLVKSGISTLNLGGSNSFTGPIAVTGGNFGVTGAGTLAGNNALSLASGSVFTTPVGGHIIGAGKVLVAGRTGATAATDIVGSIALQDNAVFEIGNSGRNGGLDPVATATITGNLSFGTGGTIYADLGNSTTPGAGVSDLITCANLTVAGTTTINVTPVGGGLAPGSYTLIAYSGVGSGLGNFVLGPLPSGTRQAFSIDTSVGGLVSLVVTGAAANLTWVGNGSTNIWDVNSASLWNNGVGSDVFKNLDSVTFNATGSNSPAINLTGNLSPGNITVTGAQDYTFDGAGILEDGAITKTGAGKLTITGNAHTFASSVQINEGTVSVAEVNDGGVAGPLGINSTIKLDGGTLEFTGASQNVNRVLDLGAAGGTVAVPAAASRLGTNQATTGAGTLTPTGSGSFLVGRDDAAYTFNTPLQGSGNIAVNPHMAVGSTTSLQVTIATIAPAFTGNLILASPASGSYRTVALAQPALANTSRVIVEDGAQLFVTGASTITSDATLTGIGYIEANGTGIGALRIDNSTMEGDVEIVGSAAINAHNSTGTVSGSISGGTLLFGGTNFNNPYTLVLTGTNSYGDTIVNTGGTGNNTSLLRVGDGGATGTLGSGPVAVNGDTKNGILRFSRSDSYTLANGQMITAGGATPAKAFLDLDVQGTGFSNAGQTIDFTGGILRTGVTVADATATLSGTINAGNIQIGILNATIPTNNATLNIASGATVTANNLNLATGGGTAPLGNTNEASVTIASGATVAIATNLYLGDQNTSGASVTQIGGDVSVGGQFRIGHWPNETSTYTLNGGTVLSNGPRTQFPQAGNETGGGIYLGIDGTGIFNQNAGTVTTGWVVLDNRGDTAGVDTYNLNGGQLVISGADGIISRNASALFNWNGGTLTAGTSFNLDTNKIVVAAPSTLNTNGNTVTLLAPLGGGASLDVTGGGTLVTADSATANFAGGGSLASVQATVAAGSTVRSNTSTTDTWQTLTGAGFLDKAGSGTLMIAGNSAGFSGTATVGNGTLQVDGTLGGTLQVNSGGTLGGSGTVGAPTIASGGIVNPGSAVPGTLTLASLSIPVGGTYRVDITDAGTSDKVNVSGAFSANGTIALVLGGAYVPEDGDSFDIADAASTTGTPVFDFSAAVLDPGLSWDTSMFMTNGTLRITSGGDPYATWASGFNLMGLDADKGADPDKDGMNNLMEFAMNGNPTSGTKARRIIPKMHPLGGDSVLTVTVAVRQGAAFTASGSTQVATQDQVLYTVEATDNFVAWNVVVVSKLNPVDSAAVQATLGLPALDAGWEWQSFRTDDGILLDPNDSVRLKVAVAP